jgi:hypothetical protein
MLADLAIIGGIGMAAQQALTTIWSENTKDDESSFDSPAFSSMSTTANPDPEDPKKGFERRTGGGKKQVDSVAREFGMDRQTRHQFGKYIEEVKQMQGRGGADNFSYKELRMLAKEFLGL